MATQGADSSERYLGRVKWFNNKAGFGFVTCLDGDRKEDDVFVHHTGVNVASEQYKYLVQGEYVNFSVKKTDNTEHPYQACDVRGVLDGLLMLFNGFWRSFSSMCDTFLATNLQTATKAELAVRLALLRGYPWLSTACFPIGGSTAGPLSLSVPFGRIPILR